MGTVSINHKKAFLFGIVVILIQLGVYSVLWLNPYVEGISNQFAHSPSVKPYEYFGGLDTWMQLRTLYNIAILAILIKVFLLFIDEAFPLPRARGYRM